MSRQEDGDKVSSLEELSALDSINILSSKLEQMDARQRARLLNALERLVSAGRRDLNARVAINRLPAEVLRQIFVTTCTVELARYRSSHYEWTDMTIGWDPTWINKGRAVHLMLVCYRWKEIALGVRELWSGIETYWEREDRILLKRSGRGPLKVLASDELKPRYAVARALQNVEHSSRIQELYWTGSLDKEYLEMSAPSLRSLALRDDERHTRDGTLNIFDNHTPCLERLSLSTLCWLPSNAFAKLTFLAIKHCYVTKSRAKIRSLLAGTPNLVDLILRNVADDIYQWHASVRMETEAADMKPVSLTRLRRLLIEDMWADDINYVFWDAQLNEDVFISIKRTKNRDDEQLALEWMSAWSLNAVKQPKELYFQQHIAIVTGASSGLRFEFRGGMTLEDWTTYNWPRTLGLSSISHLSTFERDACSPLGLEGVRNLFRQMTALETLSVNIKGLTKVIDALTLFRDPTDPPLCPTLTTLRIAIHKDSDCDIILDSVRSHRAQLGIKHLYVGLVNPENGHWTPRQAVRMNCVATSIR